MSVESSSEEITLEVIEMRKMTQSGRLRRVVVIWESRTVDVICAYRGPKGPHKSLYTSLVPTLHQVRMSC